MCVCSSPNNLSSPFLVVVASLLSLSLVSFIFVSVNNRKLIIKMRALDIIKRVESVRAQNNRITELRTHSFCYCSSETEPQMKLKIFKCKFN